ncbi:hypothetical protein V6Z12_D08G126200 [Gossypium hirsutum]
MIPKWLRKTKIVKQISQMLVNHLGLNLTKDDLQNVVDLMEPYGQISNGIEYLNPPLDILRRLDDWTGTQVTLSINFGTLVI